MGNWLVITSIQTMLAVAALAVGWFVVRPYLILQRRREQARLHRPQPEEIWVHNDEMFYIDYVNDFGVGIIKMDAKSQQPYRWRDTWPEWHQRLQTQTLFWTGAKRPLGDG